MSDPIKVPDYRAFTWATLEALRKLGNSGSILEIDDTVVRDLNLSDDQLSKLGPSGNGTVVSSRLKRARSDLKLVGAVDNATRGVWTVTELGETLSEADLFERLARDYRTYRVRLQNLSSQDETDDAVMVDAVQSVEDDSAGDNHWRETLVETLLSMDPIAFERLSQRLLREEGFTMVHVTRQSGDGGIDGVGVLRMSLMSFHVYFQCKRYRGTVGASAIRDFRGAMMGRTDKGIFITTGTFTQDARREATRDGAPVLELVDGELLCDLLKKHSLGVTTRLVEEVTVDAGWFESI